MALVAAAGCVAGAALMGLGAGAGRLVGVFVILTCFLFSLYKLAEGQFYRKQEGIERNVFRSLAKLPQRWYVLGDLVIEPSWLEPVRVWAVVVGPGGLAVVEPCTYGGDLTPFGHVWMVGRGKQVRTIPSPAAAAGNAVEALREALGALDIPITPVVVLTDMNAVYHPAEAGAQVVGAPHLPAGLLRRLSAAPGEGWDTLQIAAYLSHYHR